MKKFVLNFMVASLTTIFTSAFAETSVLDCKIESKGSFRMETNKSGFPVKLYEEVNSAMSGAKRVLTHLIQIGNNSETMIELQESNQFTGGQFLSIKINPLVVKYHEDDGDAEFETSNVKCN